MKMPSEANSRLLGRGLGVALPAIVIADLAASAVVYSFTADHWWWFRTMIAFPYFVVAGVALYMIGIVVYAINKHWDSD